MSFPARRGREKPAEATGQRSAIQRPGLFLLAGTVLLLLGVLIGIHLFFPAETLRKRIIQEVGRRTQARLEIAEVSLYPLLTVAANRISVDIVGLPEPLEIEQLTIAPLWSTLLSGDPGVQLQGSAMNGSITADLQRGGSITAEAAGLRFALPVQRPLPFTIAGTLSDASLASSMQLTEATKTLLSLRLSSVRVLGLELFQADTTGFSLGEVTLELDGEGRAMRIKTLNAKGGDLDILGHGTLLVGKTSATSHIKLELQVQPGPTADPGIASLLQLAGKPGPDGRYPLQLTGTLAKPFLKPGS